MNTPCPHCQIQIEIDAQTHAALQGHTNFQCPSCDGLVTVPPVTRAPVKVTAAAAIRSVSSEAPASTIASVFLALNRNMLTLGAAALLVLGGLGFFIASWNSGTINATTQNINYEIINNSYFQDLVASGKTTVADLEAVAGIQPYGDGFIGVSKQKATWQEAREIALRSGAMVLDPGITGSLSERQLTHHIRKSFPDSIGSGLWVSQNDKAGKLGNSAVSPADSLEAPLQVCLHWTPWKSLLSADFEESSPFGLTKARTWTTALENGHYTVRRTDSGVLWQGAGGAHAGNSTRITTRVRISRNGIFEGKAAGAVWGLLFRTGDSGNYALEIRGDGSWQFYVRRDKRNYPISQWEKGDSILPAGDYNEATVEAIGNRFKILVNGTELGSFTDDTFENGGHSLLFASGGDAFFEFDHYELLFRDD